MFDIFLSHRFPGCLKIRGNPGNSSGCIGQMKMPIPELARCAGLGILAQIRK